MFDLSRRRRAAPPSLLLCTSWLGRCVMSDLYTALHVSPKKKRTLPSSDDEDTLTPKRLRRSSIVCVHGPNHASVSFPIADYFTLVLRHHPQRPAGRRMPTRTAYLATWIDCTRSRRHFSTRSRMRSQHALSLHPRTRASSGTCSTTCRSAHTRASRPRLTLTT